VRSLKEARRVLGQDWSGAIVDLRLEDGSGFDLLETLSARPRRQRIPTVVLTGMGDRASINRAAALRARFLCKPITRTELRPFLDEAQAHYEAEQPLETACARLGLTDRERDIVRAHAAGVKRQDYASRAGISINTYKTHVRNV